MNIAPTISAPCPPVTVSLLLSTGPENLSDFRQTAKSCPLFTIEEIHVRAEIITSCLREILDVRHPRSGANGAGGSP